MSQGPLHHLRRGGLRSLPALALAALIVPSDVPLGVSLVTASLVWVPLTLLEAGARRHTGDRRLRMGATVVLSWCVIALVVGGCWLQLHYLEGLSAGLDPIQALQTTPLDGWFGLAAFLGMVVGFVLATCTAARVVAGDPDHRASDVGWIAGAQWALLWPAVGFASAAAGGSFSGGAVATFIFLPLLGVPLFAFAAWPWIRIVDRLERRWWPPERRRRTPEGPPSEVNPDAGAT